jgi:hypothetical protein
MDVSMGSCISSDLHFGKVIQVAPGKMYNHVSADAGMQQHDIFGCHHARRRESSCSASYSFEKS